MTAASMNAAAPCPCGKAAAYAECCGRFHAGPLRLQAPTAEALMRSRYSAYVLGLHDYLLATWHTSTRPSAGRRPLGGQERSDVGADIPASMTPDPPGLKWLGLDVRSHRLQDADHASVEFVARSKLAGRAHRLHETSRFVREEGRWFYVDGEIR
jgi:SEC-C motif-containing protein